MSSRGLQPSEKRRRKERFWIVIILLMIVLFGSLSGWFFEYQSDLPLLNNILLFAVINLNVILLLLLAYLLLRNIVKLIFERKRNILGHKLRTRLVIAFIALSVIPTLPLFWIATRFIAFSLDYWFSHRVEQSLEQAVSMSKDYLQQEKEDLIFDSELLKGEILSLRLIPPAEDEQFYETVMERYHLDGIFLFDSNKNIIWQVRSKPFYRADIAQAFNLPKPSSKLPPTAVTLPLGNDREGILAVIPFKFSGKSTEPAAGYMAFLRVLPANITEKLNAIASGYEDYLQLKLLHRPFKISHIVTFSIVTLLVIFAAMWFGFFLAKNLTNPIQEMVSATQKVAEGDLNIQLASERQDEIGMLINSFNKMVRDLRESRQQLDRAYHALQESHVELQDRKLYMETVLKNVAAGVVSVDAHGKVVTMNRSAEDAFGLKAEYVRGKPYWEFLAPAHMEIVNSFLQRYRSNPQNYLERQVRVTVQDIPRTFLIKASVLKDDHDHPMGVVVVLDDLTDLEKAQRMAAWREVARRIAHEVKNPLTPIQLSAQRLRRKYPQLLDRGDSVFDECTNTIIQQVEHMKHLVNEFSKFARLPRARPSPSDLSAIVEESLAIYKHTYPNISFSLRKNGHLPALMIDRDQFRQVMVNLLDNAIHALDGESGQIEVGLSYDPVLKIATLKCADTGHGIAPQDKLRMFEPYYSTKEKGTGLGLAIVANIIADHGGFIRVQDNVPKGTIIIIELPAES